MGSLVIGSRKRRVPGLEIDYSQNRSNSGYVPLQPNPGDPVTTIPVTGVGDMYKAIYDQNNNNVVDNVDAVGIPQVTGLQQVLIDLENQIGSGSPGTGTPNIITILNSGTDSFIPGRPVCKLQDGTVMIGSALEPYQRVIGLAVEDTLPGQMLKVQVSGIMSLTVSQWENVTNIFGGLQAGPLYYVSAASWITPVVTTNRPEWLIKVGQGINTTDLLIDLDLSVKL
jgi:hypothetical protein